MNVVGLILGGGAERVCKIPHGTIQACGSCGR